jgi:hypothetical protein
LPTRPTYGSSRFLSVRRLKLGQFFRGTLFIAGRSTGRCE